MHQENFVYGANGISYSGEVFQVGKSRYIYKIKHPTMPYSFESTVPFMNVMKAKGALNQEFKRLFELGNKEGFLRACLDEDEIDSTIKKFPAYELVKEFIKEDRKSNKTIKEILLDDSYNNKPLKNFLVGWLFQGYIKEDHLCGDL